MEKTNKLQILKAFNELMEEEENEEIIELNKKDIDKLLNTNIFKYVVVQRRTKDFVNTHISLWKDEKSYKTFIKNIKDFYKENNINNYWFQTYKIEN